MSLHSLSRPWLARPPARARPGRRRLEPGGEMLLVTNYSSGQLEAVYLARLP